MREFTHLDVAQRSAEWLQARAGRLTASRAADMVATIKSGEAAARRDLRLQLAVERLTGRPTENGYINAEMQRGIDCEPLARAAYEATTGAFVHETGFLAHNTILAGCSLDGHVGDFETIVSLKCPKSATHLGYLRTGLFPVAYVPQMLHELWITGAQYYDFLSWDDRMPEGLQTFYIRVHRIDPAVDEYAAKAVAFLAEVEHEVAAVDALREVRVTYVRVYHGFVDDAGHLGMDDPAAYRAALAHLHGEEVDVTIRRRRYPRSLKANAYYHGVVVHLIAEYCGYEHAEMHNVLAFNFLRIENCPITGVPRRRSTRELTPQEFGDYVDRCIRFAAELGVVIPDATTVAA